MSTQEIQAVEAKRAAVTQKLKKPTWNVPDEIPLVPSSELVVGRCPGKSIPDSKAIILHSSKLPSMLSRRHARIKYDTSLKQWTITDLKVKFGIVYNNIMCLVYLIIRVSMVCMLVMKKSNRTLLCLLNLATGCVLVSTWTATT